MCWRYQCVLLGGLCFVLSIIGIFFMKIEESTKWLVAQGRLEEAVEELSKVGATCNERFSTCSRHCPQLSKRGISEQAVRSSNPARYPKDADFYGVVILWMAIGIACAWSIFPLSELLINHLLCQRVSDLYSVPPNSPTEQRCQPG